MASGSSHADYLSVHEGVSCDGCQSQNFRGNRFKCLRCYDFDLCQRCFNDKRYGEPGQGNRVNVNHLEQHPMQLILTHRDFEVVYEGEPSKNYDQCKILSFTCPYCSVNGFDIRGFIAHVHTHTVPSQFNVLCPICIALPEFDSNREIPDLRLHVGQMHGQHETVYRSEPQRSTTRRPMLARRTQRQPAGQAGTFASIGALQAQPQIVNAATPFGWADMGEVDEMFRLVNMNRLPNIQGEPSKNYDQCKILSFTCPYCSVNGFDIRGFIAHVHTHTVPSQFNVLCPICIALPEFDSNREIPDLRLHVGQMHGQHETVYRSEPQRSTTRRPMLARRTQRQPAGQAGTFASIGALQAQPQIVNAATPFGWADMGEVDEMFRLVNMNRLPNIQSLATTMGLVGQTAQVTANVTNAATGVAQFAQLAAGWNQPMMRERGFAGTTARTVPMMHGGPSYGEYAQPRQTSAGQGIRAPPIPVTGTAPMRIIRAVPVYPANSSDEDSQMTPIVSDTYLRNDVFDSVPNSEHSRDDSLDDIPLEYAPVAGEEFDGVRNGSGKRNLDNDSEFEFDITCFNKSVCDDELAHMRAPADTTIEPVEPGTEITEKDILRVLRKNVTDDEFEEIQAILNTEFSAGLEKTGTPNENERIRDIGVDVQNWASYQFDICPLADFGSGGYWSDKRFLRQRKLQREASQASNVEDLLNRSEVALAFVRACAGPSSTPSNSRLYDSECQSLRRPCEPLEVTSRSRRAESVDDEIMPETKDEERNQMLVNVTRRLESECEQSADGMPPAISDLDAYPDLAGSGGEDSSDDEDERSSRQDDLEFLPENN